MASALYSRVYGIHLVKLDHGSSSKQGGTSTLRLRTSLQKEHFEGQLFWWKINLQERWSLNQPQR